MFTLLNEPRVESSIQEQMDVVVKETTRVYGKDCSIILAGGFGRGEGSIRILESGKAVPLHDYDLFIVTDKRWNARDQAHLEQTIRMNLSAISGIDLNRERFALGLQVIPARSLSRLPPDLSTYELKIASSVIYGRDVRPLITIEKGNVALGSGAITLFHRITALLKNVEPEYLRLGDYPSSRRLETVYECCKVYTEICTALSLLGRFYEPSYHERALRFRDNYRLFPGLQARLPDLDEKILRYTEMKLRSDFSRIIDRPAELWVRTRRDLETSLRYFLSKFLRQDANESWFVFCQTARERLRRFLFRDYISFLLARLGVQSPIIVDMANIAFQAYDSVVFGSKVRKSRGNSSHLFSFTSPILDVYLASLLVLFSISDDGSIDRNLLAIGNQYVGRFFTDSTSHPDGVETWKNSRDNCVGGQRIYFSVNKKRSF